MKNLLVSVSGGRTSGFMAAYLKRTLPDTVNTVYVFANTGQEHPKTIEFLKNLNKEFDLDLKCVEAIVHKETGVGTKYKLVDIGDLYMGGQLFIDVCNAYGIPNASYPHCNRELKLQPMHKFASDCFGEKYHTAIGIRADEFDRMDSNREEKMYVYPLISDITTTKGMVRQWWSNQSFDLEIPEHYGNCLTCWKKSKRKHLTLAKEHPEWFDLFDEIEKMYGWSGSIHKDQTEPRVFFRNYQSTQDILRESKGDFIPFKDESQPDMFIDDMDIESSCTFDCSSN